MPRTGATCWLILSCLLAAAGARPSARAAMLPGTRGDGIADLYVAGRDLILHPDGAAINGFILTSQDAMFRGESYPSPVGLFLTEVPAMLADQFGFILTAPRELGRLLPAGTPLEELAADLTLTYTVEGQAGIRQATILPAPMGDCDLDGKVGRSDVLRMKETIGIAQGAFWLDADFDGDGMVGVLDYITLKQCYGTAAPAGPAGAAPEPAALALLAVAAAAGLRGRRSRA